MCQATIVATADGHVRGVLTWTEGFQPLKCPRRQLTEDDVLAIAVRLERRGLHDLAEEVILRFIAGFRIDIGTA